MLGENVGNTQGKVTGRRVLPSEGGPSVEITIAEAGKTLGLDVQVYATYSADLRPDGTLFGSGQGVAMAANGEGATFTGSGVGRFTEQGGASFRGALYFQSTGATLSRLNGVAVVFEHDADATDNTSTKLWEWK